MRLRDIDALAIDFDRTLTDPDLRLVPEALSALARARAAGRKVVVVSGRSLAFLISEVGAVCDALVAENGAILHVRETRRLAPVLDLDAVLADLPFPIERGDVLASVDLAHEALLGAAYERASVPVQLIRNRDRVMALPRGIDKAVGALAALEALGVPRERAAAAGDGENDVVMLRALGYGIAVENAVPELKEIADDITKEYGGHGIAAWIDRAWLPALEAPA